MARRLAAIMFTDIAGYTALTQQDEKAALRLLEEQEGLVRPILGAHQGRRVKSTGDGLLIEFPDALDAVECGVDLQRHLHERNARPGSPPLRVRVGIHLGDVQEVEGDIFGDAVNIASRIEPLADPGGVCLSEPVFVQVRNKVPYRLERLGAKNLKGVESPVDVYRVALPWTAEEPPTPASTVPRLAVLPLANISPDARDEYFADGLTEELITVLSQIKGLRVISRTSVNQYKGTTKPVAQIGSELGAGSVLEGSVRKAGDQLRITVQLIDTRTDEHRWARTYDRRLENVFAIQADVAESTAAALQVELLSSEREALRERPTPSLPAYEEYLRGIEAFRRFAGWGDEKTDTEAERCFEAAIQADPQFSGAHSYLANHLLAAMGITRPWRETVPRARELATKAVALNPSSADAHTALANLAFQGELDWPKAETELQQAIALNPSSSTARFWYGFLLGVLQRFSEGRKQYLAAIELDPLWSLPRRNLAWSYGDAGDRGTCIELFEQVLDRFGDDPRLRPQLERELVLAYALGGRKDKVLELVAPWKGSTDRFARSVRALVLAVLGSPQELKEYADQALSGRVVGLVSLAFLAIFYAVLGETERALSCAEREQREGDRCMWLYYQHPVFDPLRDEPRFVALVRSMNLPTTLKRPRWAPPAPGTA